MNFEMLFSEQKWNILEALSEGEYSPLQLAEKSKTTMANISQQLRLLEASNLVKKNKIPNREKGKPRSLFSLTNDHAYAISATRWHAEKKLLNLDKMHKILFRALFFEKDLRYFSEKFFWEIENHIEEIEAAALKDSGKDIDVILVSKNAELIEKKIRNISVKKENITKTFKVRVLNFEEKKNIGKFLESNYQIVYDPNLIIKKEVAGKNH